METAQVIATKNVTGFTICMLKSGEKIFVPAADKVVVGMTIAFIRHKKGDKYFNNKTKAEAVYKEDGVHDVMIASDIVTFRKQELIAFEHKLKLVDAGDME